MSRNPIDTAMIATEMLARNSSANPERNDTRSTASSRGGSRR